MTRFTDHTQMPMAKMNWIFALLILLTTSPLFAAGDSSPDLRAGAATAIITPPLGSWQQGAGVTVRGEEIRDELEANALYLTDGQTPLLFL
ncbi:MAG: hypothetical protein KC978_10930, partial [Candidatus Omnitrophica bacterium]|nr:hypothetical protein [Candidatus Omnitrophota bacterium]